MRFIPFITLFFVGCSSQGPLKYKYFTSKRGLASEPRQIFQVGRIEVGLRDENLFASGMDSTFVIARLFDRQGGLLTSIDPSDLTLSTSVDIKAKPFTFKQGVYKAEILPRVKSANIKIRVDWQGKVLSDEVELATTVKPRKDQLIPIGHEYFDTKGFGEINLIRGSGTPENLTDGFSFDNVGSNRIVNTSKFPSSSRSFNFEYVEHARQNVQLHVEDNVGGEEGETTHVLYMFFPRKQLPVVEQLIGTLNVTLSNGEKIVFQKDSKEIVEGVLSEGPLTEQVPDLKYKGNGLILKATGKGHLPQLSEDEAAPESVVILNGATGQRCKRPKTDFWEQVEVNPVEFRFPKDEEFEEYLKSKCGFGFSK